MTLQNIVKSVTPVTVTIAAGATSGTASINITSTSNAFIEWGGQTCQGGSSTPDKTMGYFDPITSTSVVTAHRSTSDASNSMTLYGTVIEYAPGVIKSIQSSNIALATVVSNTYTLPTGITNANAFVAYQGTAYNSTNDFSHNIFANVSLSGNIVTAARKGTANTLTVYFTVVEFQPGILQSSTAPFSINLSTVQLTNTAAISVTAANSMLVYGGQNMSTSNATWTQWDKDNAWMKIDSGGTTVTATRTSEDGTSIVITGTVVEFKTGVIKSATRGNIVIGASSNSNTQALPTVNTAFTAASFQGWTASGGSGTTDNVKEIAVSITNATTLTGQTNSNDAANTRTVGFEGIEYFPYGVTTGNMMLCF